MRESYVDGPAALVVEIVSPDGDERARVDKLREYEAAGIPEYWRIDRRRREGFFYEFGPDGRYRRAPLDADGYHHEQVQSEFRLGIVWPWQRPLLRVIEVLSQTEA